MCIKLMPTFESRDEMTDGKTDRQVILMQLLSKVLKKEPCSENDEHDCQKLMQNLRVGTAIILNLIIHSMTKQRA